MRGEFIGVWSETWREIWLPLIDELLDEGEESVPEDIFCELYQELVMALKKPTSDAAIILTLEDTVCLREAIDLSGQVADPEVVLELVEAAFQQLGATEMMQAEEWKAAVDTALFILLGQPASILIEAQLQEIARNPSKIEEARQRALEPILNDPEKSRKAFENLKAEDLAGEWTAVKFLESAYDTLEDFGGDELSNRYFNLLDAFIKKFSLRYDLRRPCILCPTLPGVFASLVCDLRALTGADPDLDPLMKEFENAVRDLRYDCSDGRIKTCIQKQVNLLEAIGRTCPGVTAGELGSICGQINSWPHPAVRAALGNLYGFASSYPGIRHGGNAASALRNVDMRDLVAMSILLTGFTPYLTDRLNADLVYRGA